MTGRLLAITSTTLIFFSYGGCLIAYLGGLTNISNMLDRFL